MQQPHPQAYMYPQFQYPVAMPSPHVNHQQRYHPYMSQQHAHAHQAPHHHVVMPSAVPMPFHYQPMQYPLQPAPFVYPNQPVQPIHHSQSEQVAEPNPLPTTPQPLTPSDVLTGSGSSDINEGEDKTKVFKRRFTELMEREGEEAKAQWDNFRGQRKCTVARRPCVRVFKAFCAQYGKPDFVELADDVRFGKLGTVTKCKCE